MELSQKQKKQLKIFKRLLKETNPRLNLFSRKSPDKQLRSLFSEGLKAAQCLFPVLSQNKDPVLDVGTGGGWPGLLFAILYPSSSFDLCEKSQKKAEFLKQVVFEARVLNARVLCLRAEETLQPYNIILSQAALPLKKAPLLLKKTLSLKGRAFLWQSAKNAGQWPDEDPCLKARVFASYTAGASSRVLLEIRRRR